MQDPHPFVGEVRHIGAQIVEQRLPAAEDRLCSHRLGDQVQGGNLDDLERSHAGFSHAWEILQDIGIGDQKARESTEFINQLPGQRLGVAARNGQRQQIFDQLVIVQAVGLTGQYPAAQPGAMTAGAAWWRGLISGLPDHFPANIRTNQERWGLRRNRPEMSNIRRGPEN